MKLFKFALTILFVAGLAACGDDEAETGERQRDDPAPVQKAEGAEDTSGKPIENKDWNDIKPYFLGLENDVQTGFVRGPVQTLRDPFETKLLKWIPKIEIPEEELAATEEAAPEEEVPLPPVDVVPPGETQRFAVQDYKVLLIRWGTSVNKALVQDPEGTEFMITKDMKLGDGNGRVTDITRYDVVVKEDSRDEPIVLTIRPELMPLGEGGTPSERLFINQSRE